MRGKHVVPHKSVKKDDEMAFPADFFTDCCPPLISSSPFPLTNPDSWQLVCMHEAVHVSMMQCFESQVQATFPCTKYTYIHISANVEH